MSRTESVIDEARVGDDEHKRMERTGVGLDSKT